MLKIILVNTEEFAKNCISSIIMPVIFEGQHCVYILYSTKDHNLYVGYTSDINDRMTRHTNGHVTSTKNRRPLILIHCEHYTHKDQALERERYLKSLHAAREKQRIKKQFLSDSGLI